MSISTTKPDKPFCIKMSISTTKPDKPFCIKMSISTTKPDKPFCIKMSSMSNVYIIIMFRNCQYQSFHYVQVLPISKIQKTWWMDDHHYQYVMA